ncbi:MAG: MFS transporter [Anaerolineae bacterium]
MMTLNSDKTYHRRWWILGAVLMTTWVGTLLNSMMPVALPSMLAEYRVGLNLGVWIISVYTLLFAVLAPVFGWLGDRYGYRRIYAVGVALLLLSSWGAALAPTFGWLIFFRAWQGIGSAMTLPSIMGIISDIFPKAERGSAMGVWAAVNGAAHGLGPVISGYLIQYFAWPANFWLSGAIFWLSAAFIFIIPSDFKRDSRPFDFVGAGALTLAIMIFMFTLTQGSDFGWASGLTLSLWASGLTLLILFIIAERRAPYPFVELQLLANKRYTTVTAIIFTQFFCLMGLQLLMSFYLIQLRGFATGLAGLLIAPLASTSAIFSPLAGRTVDRLGYRVTLIAGTVTIALAAASMAFWDAATPLWLVVLTLIIIGLGMGFTQSPAATGVTLAVRPDELGGTWGFFRCCAFWAVPGRHPL